MTAAPATLGLAVGAGWSGFGGGSGDVEVDGCAGFNGGRGAEFDVKSDFDGCLGRFRRKSGEIASGGVSKFCAAS